jgi:hypothetical protein
MYNQIQLEAFAHELVRRSYKKQMFIRLEQFEYYEGVYFVVSFNNPGTTDQPLDGSLIIIYIFANGASEETYA